MYNLYQPLRPRLIGELLSAMLQGLIYVFIRVSTIEQMQRGECVRISDAL